MPREDYKNYGKPRNHYKTEAPPQKASKRLKARQASYDDVESKGLRKLSPDDGYRRPGSQNPRK